jgi:ATP-dependent 26S proteasome regulatory subunit
MKAKLAQNCSAIVKDKSKPPEVRAEFLILSANEVGFDLMKPLAQLIERNDHVLDLEKQLAELKSKVAAKEKEVRPLKPEIFLRKLEGLAVPAALVLCESGPMVCPFGQDLGELRCGDFVFVESGTGKVVARDGQILPPGEIVRLEEIPDDGNGQVVVKLRDERFTAYISDTVRESPGLKTGAEAVYDPHRHFVHRLIQEKVDGTDILTPLSELSGFNLDSLGAPHPVINKILQVLKRDLLHPEWKASMGARMRHSYLFYGPSGGGKTSSIKVIVNLIADLFEEITGKREVRVVFCDVSTFYSPYLGESEQRITRWFKKLGAQAKIEVVAKDGRIVQVPVVVVFEEIDGLVRQRGEFGASSHLFDRLLSLILMKMSSATNELDAPILTISTSNKKELLDFAARRRFAEREAYFGTLDARAALSVLEKKVVPEMKIHPCHGSKPAAARRNLLHAVIQYLYGGGEDQVIAEVTFRDSARKSISRRDLVTGALLEMAVSEAIDEALDHSTEAGELLGLDAGTVTEALSRQFQAIATSMRPHNVSDHAPHLFQEDEVLVASVRPRLQSGRRPASSYTN